MRPRGRPSPWARALAVARRWQRPLLALAAAAVLGWIGWNARRLDWPGAWQAMRALPAPVPLAALALTVLGHAHYGLFDLLSARHWHVPLSRQRVWLVAVVSYAFNLNLGSIVGGAALRWRLYVQAGATALQAARVFGLSVFSNWLGYAVLTSAVLLAGQGLLQPPGPPDAGGSVAREVRHWLAGRGPVWLGTVLGALVLGYLVTVLARQGRAWHLRRTAVTVPRPAWVAAQLAVGAGAWLWTASVPWMLLQGAVPYPRVLATHLLASIVVVAARIPGGLGVLEAVYLVMLGDALPAGTLLGALVLFRVLYYFVPLGWGSAAYWWLERQPGPLATVPAGTAPVLHSTKESP